MPDPLDSPGIGLPNNFRVGMKIALDRVCLRVPLQYRYSVQAAIYELGLAYSHRPYLIQPSGVEPYNPWRIKYNNSKHEEWCWSFQLHWIDADEWERWKEQLVRQKVLATRHQIDWRDYLPDYSKLVEVGRGDREGQVQISTKVRLAKFDRWTRPIEEMIGLCFKCPRKYGREPMRPGPLWLPSPTTNLKGVMTKAQLQERKDRVAWLVDNPGELVRELDSWLGAHEKPGWLADPRWARFIQGDRWDEMVREKAIRYLTKAKEKVIEGYAQA